MVVVTSCKMRHVADDDRLLREQRAGEDGQRGVLRARRSRTSPSSGTPPVICSLSMRPLAARRAFLGSQRLDRHRVDLAPHQLAERPVDELMARDGALAGELLATTTRAAKCVLSSDSTRTSAPGRPARISSATCSGLMGGYLRKKGVRSGESRLCATATCYKATSLPSASQAFDMQPARAASADPAAACWPPRAARCASRRAPSRPWSPRLDERFADGLPSCAWRCQGRVVVTGMGKSGHIAGKIAATLASTGTPAFFLHPAEAGHGDLGMITRTDVVLAISNSGETRSSSCWCRISNGSACRSS